MSNTESTAVTAFINTVQSQLEDGYLPPQQKPLQKPPALSARRPQATPRAQPAATGTPAPEMAQVRQARGTMPPPVSVEAIAEPELDPTTLPPLPQARPAAPPPRPAAPPPFTPPPVRAKSQLIVPPHIEENNFDDTTPLPKSTLDMQVEDSWFDSAPTPTDDHGLVIDFEEESADFLSPTEMVEMDLDHPVRRKWGLIGAGALVLAGGIGVAAYIAMSGPDVSKATTASASTAARPAAATQKKAAAAPAPAPMATRAPPAAAPAPAADPVDVPEGGVVLARAHFASTPAGATVTLVMNGKPVVLGEAPVDAQLDPNKPYQAMFTMPGHGTVLRDITFDGSEEIAIAADLDNPAPAAAPAVAEVAPIADEPAAEEPAVEAAAPAPAPKHHERHAARRTHHRTKSRAARRSHRSASRKATREVASRSKNSGILMINSKPPCGIVVDGHSTGKKTPAPRLSLSAGKHTITLVNRTYRIKKSFKVTIRAGAKTRVLKDMTDRIH